MLNKLWHNGIPSSTGIKQTTDTTWNNIGEAHKYNVKWKKKKKQNTENTYLIILFTQSSKIRQNSSMPWDDRIVVTLVGRRGEKEEIVSRKVQRRILGYW